MPTTRTVLYVDDSASMQTLISGWLQMYGFKVEVAGNGVVALEKIDKGLQPALVITDINMPRMGGMSLTAEIRQRLRFTPILALTTESTQERKEEGKRNGISGWLVKPVTSLGLLNAIRMVLGEEA